MPQPMSTPTMFGTTLSRMVMVVPMVQLAPVCTSGMMRMVLPANTSLSHIACTCSTAEGSATSVKIFASLYVP